MDEKPDALRLADEMLMLKAWNSAGGPKVLMEKAAAELRRLHEVNAELLEALCKLVEHDEYLIEELRRLYEVNAELLEALKVLLNNNEALTGENIARAAIAKAEGK